MQLSSMGISQQVMQAMGNSAKVMGKVNEEMNVQQIQQMIKEFQKQGMITEMKQEQMEMAMDIGADQTEEADDVYNQILGEIGLNMENGAVVGNSKLPQKQVAQQEEAKNEEIDDLEARLAALQ